WLCITSESSQQRARQQQEQEEGDAQQNHATSARVTACASYRQATSYFRSRSRRHGRHQRPDGPAANTPGAARAAGEPAEPAGTVFPLDLARSRHRAYAGAHPGLLFARGRLRAGSWETARVAVRPPAAAAVRPGSPGQRAGGGRSRALAPPVAWTVEKRFTLPCCQ